MTNDQLEYRSAFYTNYVSKHVRSDNSSAEFGTHLKSRKPFFKKIIKQHFPKNKGANIIDIGCGNAALLQYANKQGYQYLTGYDLSHEQIQVARSIGFENIHQQDALSALKNLTDNSVDVILAFDVIEHLTKSEAVLLSKETHRVLKSGGKWIIHTLNGESPFFGRIRYGDFTHENGFTSGSIKQLLRMSGFQKIFCYEDTPIIHGVKSLIRFLIWKIIRVLYRIHLAAETGETNGIFTQNFIVTAEKEK